MRNRAIRVYADTSVFGGVFDPEFEQASSRFFQLVRKGEFRLVISDLVEEEIRQSPNHVKGFLNEMVDYAEFISTSPGAITLQRAYLEAKILTPRWELDALHVALASVAECAIIVSWNFKHIVNFRKIPLYNGVNMIKGYGPIAIHSPMEIIADET